MNFPPLIRAGGGAPIETPPPNSPEPYGPGENNPTTVSPALFWVSAGINIGTGALIRSERFNNFLEENNLPKISPKLHFPINLGVSIGTMYGFYGLGLIQAPNLGAMAFQTLPLMGFNLVLPYVIDGTLGSIPYLDTFQAGQTGNGFLTFGISIYNGLRIFTRTGWAAKVITLSEEGAFSYNFSRAGWVGVAALIGAAATKALDMVIDGIDSTVTDYKTRDADPLVQMRKKAEAAMDDLVYRRWFQEGTQDIYGRSFGGLVSMINTSTSKQFRRIYERLTSNQIRENILVQENYVRAKMISGFNQWARNGIAQAIVNYTENSGSEEFHIHWDKVDVDIRALYASNPNVQTFYQYDYASHSMSPGYFPGGKDASQSIEELKKLVDIYGGIDDRGSDSAQFEVLKGKLGLIDLAIRELDPVYQELSKKYPDDQLNQIPKELQEKNPEIVQYLAYEEYLKRLTEVRKKTEKEKETFLTDSIQKLNQLVDQDGKLNLNEEEKEDLGFINRRMHLLQAVIEEVKPTYITLRRKYPEEILENIPENEQAKNPEVIAYLHLQEQLSGLVRVNKVLTEAIKTNDNSKT